MVRQVKILLVISGLLLTHYSFGQLHNQTVKITNIEQVKGYLYIGWYKDSSTFRINDKAIYREKIIITNQKEVSVVFKGIPSGRYAIAVFLDENDNYKLDRNVFGIPVEKYGFSNNILPRLRAATFKESAFEIRSQESIITIKLK